MKEHSMAGTVADRIAEALGRHGVEMIFAQSLPSALILAAEARGIRQIAYRQENMGGAMADGYARAGGDGGDLFDLVGPFRRLLERGRPDPTIASFLANSLRTACT